MILFQAVACAGENVPTEFSYKHYHNRPMFQALHCACCCTTCRFFPVSVKFLFRILLVLVYVCMDMYDVFT